MTWYAVKATFFPCDPDEEVWTVSKSPILDGWCTDGGSEGYGLNRADAEFLANAANAAEEKGLN